MHARLYVSVRVCKRACVYVTCVNACVCACRHKLWRRFLVRADIFACISCGARSVKCDRCEAAGRTTGSRLLDGDNASEKPCLGCEPRLRATEAKEDSDLHAEALDAVGTPRPALRSASSSTLTRSGSRAVGIGAATLAELNTEDVAREFAERMNKIGVMRTFEADELIYEEGEFLQGRIIMVDEGELVMEKLHGGKYISFGVAKTGELTDLFSPVLGTPSMFTVRARTSGVYIEVQSSKLRPSKSKFSGPATATTPGPLSRSARTISRSSADVAWFWYVYALFLVKALRSAVSTAAKSDSSVKADASEMMLKKKLEFQKDVLAHYGCSHETKGMHAHG